MPYIVIEVDFEDCSLADAASKLEEALNMLENKVVRGVVGPLNLTYSLPDPDSHRDYGYRENGVLIITEEDTMT